MGQPPCADRGGQAWEDDDTRPAPLRKQHEKSDAPLLLRLLREKSDAPLLLRLLREKSDAPLLLRLLREKSDAPLLLLRPISAGVGGRRRGYPALRRQVAQVCRCRILISLSLPPSSSLSPESALASVSEGTGPRCGRGNRIGAARG